MLEMLQIFGDGVVIGDDALGYDARWAVQVKC